MRIKCICIYNTQNKIMHLQYNILKQNRYVVIALLIRRKIMGQKVTKICDNCFKETETKELGWMTLRILVRDWNRISPNSTKPWFKTFCSFRCLQEWLFKDEQESVPINDNRYIEKF